MKTIKIFGGEIPLYQDCTWCKAEDVCKFAQYTYEQPCSKCKATERYLDTIKPKERSMQDMLDVNKPASVWEGNGRQFIVNKKGNVIREEKSKPLPVGRKDWR